jgi:hypothetical protein
MESSFPRKREPRATGNPLALHLTSSWFEMDRLPAFTAPIRALLEFPRFCAQMFRSIHQSCNKNSPFRRTVFRNGIA